MAAWISVNDRLPQFCQRVIVCVAGIVKEAERQPFSPIRTGLCDDFETWYWHRDGFWANPPGTYWQPLPDPPEGT